MTVLRFCTNAQSAVISVEHKTNKYFLISNCRIRQGFVLVVKLLFTTSDKNVYDFSWINVLNCQQATGRAVSRENLKHL